MSKELMVWVNSDRKCYWRFPKGKKHGEIVFPLRGVVKKSVLDEHDFGPGAIAEGCLHVPESEARRISLIDARTSVVVAAKDVYSTYQACGGAANKRIPRNLVYVMVLLERRLVEYERANSGRGNQQ